MIGDLTGAPQPVVVKLFSPDAELLGTWAPRVADALGKIEVKREEAGRGYSGRNREHNQRPGRCLHRESTDGRQSRLSADQLAVAASAIVDGEPATNPVIINDRPYTLRVALPGSESSLARSDEQYAAGKPGRRYRDPRLRCDGHRAARADRNSAREPAARRRSDRATGRAGSGYGRRRCQESRKKR